MGKERYFLKFDFWTKEIECLNLRDGDLEVGLGDYFKSGFGV